MNEYVIREMVRQRGAERQEAARLARLAREQRAAERERRAADREQRRRGGVPARGGEPANLPPIPNYVDGTFTADRRATSTGRAAAER